MENFIFCAVAPLEIHGVFWDLSEDLIQSDTAVFFTDIEIMWQMVIFFVSKSHSL